MDARIRSGHDDEVRARQTSRKAVWRRDFRPETEAAAAIQIDVLPKSRTPLRFRGNDGEGWAAMAPISRVRTVSVNRP